MQVNGKRIAGGKVDHNLAEWNVPFVNGKNTIEVVAFKNGKSYKDTLSVNFQLQPHAFENIKTPFKQVNVLLGAKRYLLMQQTSYGYPTNLTVPEVGVPSAVNLSLLIITIDCLMVPIKIFWIQMMTLFIKHNRLV